jgi:hypothetical protein
MSTLLTACPSSSRNSGSAERRVALPADIGQLVLDYWDKHGKKLKDYRDLAQHHALVASDVRIFLAPSGQSLLYMTLPNNPMAKSATALSYSNPAVHATIYLETEFVALIRFAHELVRRMVDPRGPHKSGPRFRFKGPLAVGPGALREGTTVPTPVEIEARFTRLLRELNAKLKPVDGTGA